MGRIIIAGGGWAGCSAALQARKMGAEVLLLERTDMLLGTGLVGGIMRNNGRFTATEEMIAMGGGELFQVVEENLRHKGISFPGHEHADLYDIGSISAAVTRRLIQAGVKIYWNARVVKADMEGRRIRRIWDMHQNEYPGDGFIDTTGTAGPMSLCGKYGNGCAMCVLRCPSFGGRLSLTSLAGVEEIQGRRGDGSVGSMSGSCKLLKESLSQGLQSELNEKGVVAVPLPKDKIKDHLDLKSCQQYALPEFRDNLILLDTGHAKLMTPYFALEDLHQIPGFENARYEDPYAGGKGNSMRYFAMAPRENNLKVKGIENLYCAGEKAGLLVGHTEAIITGVIAGYNCTAESMGKETVVLGNTLAVGDAISFTAEEMKTESGRKRKYTFSGSCYFQRMQENGLYTTDAAKIRSRVEQAGMTDFFAGKSC